MAQEVRSLAARMTTKRAPKSVRKFHLGPVFWCEWRRVSRDRWFYVVRSILVAGLVAGLAAVCWGAVYRLDLTQAERG